MHSVVFEMNGDHLNRLLAQATDSRASDMHLIAGVPPSFRVNGEIIFADEDAVSVEDVTNMTFSLLSEDQRRQFEREWELCISLPHNVAGRVRVTVYRRN